MSKLNQIFLMAILVAGSSCKKCEGVDTISSLNGVAIYPGFDSAQYFDPTPQDSFFITFLLLDQFGTRPGTGDCDRKKQSVQNEGSWTPNAFKLSCNRPFIHNTDTFKAHSNLLGTPVCRQNIGLQANGRLAGQSYATLYRFRKPELDLYYTFYFEGTTSDNIIFKDSCTIYIH